MKQKPTGLVRRVYERARRQEGLTFVELVITVVILGMITAATAAAFGVSIQASSSANDRIKKTNDAQALATFLQRDAASAGGYDERNALVVAAGTQPSATQAAPGVDTDGANKGFCDQAGSRVRFEWLERGDATSITRVVANYGITPDTETLVRHYCTQAMVQTAGTNGAFVLTPTGGITETSAPLGKHIANASALCSPECTPANRLPATVSLAITASQGSGDATPYTYTLSGFVRTGGASAQTNSETVPLITLGVPTGSQCPTQPTSTGASSGIAVSGSDGSNVIVDGIAAINTQSTQCGNVVNLPGFYAGASRLNATQTLIQDGTPCGNCGPTVVSGAVPDPYAGVVAPPTFNANACNGSSNPNRTVNGDRYIYSPGVYPRTLVLAEYGPARYEFNPGVYIFCRGINVFSGTTISSNPSNPGGTLFYFAGGSLRRIGNSPDGNYVNRFEFTDVQILLEGHADYRNIAIWQPNPTRSGAGAGSNPTGGNSAANTTGDLQISAGDNQCEGDCGSDTAPFRSNIRGVVYAPQAQVEIFFPYDLYPANQRDDIIVPVPMTISGVVARSFAVGRSAAARIGPGPQTTVTLTANPNPSNVGQPVTLRAVVSPVAPATGTPTGVVAFYDNNEVLGSAPVVGGVAEFVSTTIGGGNRELQAIYSGDNTFGASSSPIINQTGNAGSSSTVISTSSNPSGQGQPLTIRATVGGAGPVATGNVTFAIDGTTVGTYPLVAGVASFVNTTLTEGTHTITAQYLGSATYNPSQDTYTQEVREGTVTVLTSNPNPSNPGQSVTLTADIGTTNGGDPDGGTVTFRDGNTVLGTATVVDGEAVLVTDDLVTPGSHALSATFEPTADLAGSSGTRAHTVDRAPTNTVLVSNPNPSGQGSSVTLTATVTSAVSGIGTPTGTVTFRDGSTTLGTSNLSGAGVATLNTDDIGSGNRTLTATYNGSTTFATSVGTRAHTVSGIATRTVLSRDGGTTVELGEDIDLDADVYRLTSNFNRPTVGSVTFYDNGVAIGNGSRTNSTWSLNNVNFDIGEHEVVAVYNGGSGGGNNFAASTSNTLTFTVAGYPTQIALTRTGGPNPSAPGEQVTFRAQITDNAPGSPAGEIIFRDNGQEIGRGTISGGQVFFSTSSLALGDHPLSAVYEGGGNFAASDSNTLTHSVRRGTVVAVTSSPNPSNQGQAVTFTATVTSPTGGGTPTGSVEFFDNGNLMGSSNLNGAGVATLSRSNLTGGTHTITAEYNPTGTTFAGSTSPGHTHTVNRLATAVSWVTGGFSGTGPNPSNRNSEVTFTVRVQSGSTNVNGGSVSFYDGSTLLATDNSVNNGVFSIDWTFTTAGVRSITAVYNGNTTYEPSTSPVWTQSVNGSATNVLLSRSPSQTSQGQTVTFLADVDENVTGTPTGQVQFLDNGVVVATVNVAGNGTATWATNALSVGTHPIVARYLGDSNFAADDSSTVNHVVLGPPPVITAISPASRPDSGTPTSITVTGTGFSGPMIASFQRGSNCPTFSFTNGISNISVVVNSSTSITINFTPSTSASECDRLITVENADGQDDQSSGSGSQRFTIT